MEVLRFQKAQVNKSIFFIDYYLIFAYLLIEFQANQGNKKDLQKQLEEDISENKPVKDITSSVKDAVVKFHLQEHEVITSVRCFIIFLCFVIIVC